MEYVLDLHPSETLRPEYGSPDRAQVSFFGFMPLKGSMMAVLLIDLLLGMIENKSPFFIKPLLKPIFTTDSRQF